jgi:hypothetical protein
MSSTALFTVDLHETRRKPAARYAIVGQRQTRVKLTLAVPPIPSGERYSVTDGRGNRCAGSGAPSGLANPGAVLAGERCEEFGGRDAQR